MRGRRSCSRYCMGLRRLLVCLFFGKLGFEWMINILIRLQVIKEKKRDRSLAKKESTVEKPVEDSDSVYFGTGG